MLAFIGVGLGLASACIESVGQVLAKKLSNRDPFVVSLMRFLPSVPFIALLIFCVSEWALPPLPYWLLVGAVIAPLEILLSYLFVRSVAEAPLSVVAPLFAFSSIFLIPLGYVVLGEQPSMLGAGGVLLILGGTFFLSLEKGGTFGSNIVSILKNKGCFYALLAALLAACLVILSKYAFRYVSPLHSAFYTTLLMSLYLMVIVYLRRNKAVVGMSVRPLELGAIGFVQAGVIVTHFIGLSYLPAVYFISLKRFSMVASVVSGRIFFGEKQLGMRLMGSVLMFFGVVLIAFASL